MFWSSLVWLIGSFHGLADPRISHRLLLFSTWEADSMILTRPHLPRIVALERLLIRSEHVFSSNANPESAVEVSPTSLRKSAGGLIESSDSHVGSGGRESA